MRRHLFLLICFFLVNFFSPVMAAVGSAGELASVMTEGVQIASNFLAIGSLILGITFVFASFLRYMQHRVNPLAHPISTVIMLLIMGILLLCLPYTYQLTGVGLPFSFSF